MRQPFLWLLLLVLLPLGAFAQRPAQSVYYYTYLNQALTTATLPPAYNPTVVAPAPLKRAVAWRLRAWAPAGSTFTGVGVFRAYAVMGAGTGADPLRYYYFKDLDCALEGAADSPTWACGDWEVVGYATYSPMAILYVPVGVTLNGGGASVNLVVEVVEAS